MLRTMVLYMQHHFPQFPSPFAAVLRRSGVDALQITIAGQRLDESLRVVLDTLLDSTNRKGLLVTANLRRINNISPQGGSRVSGRIASYGASSSMPKWVFSDST